VVGGLLAVRNFLRGAMPLKRVGQKKGKEKNGGETVCRNVRGVLLGHGPAMKKRFGKKRVPSGG